MSKESQTPAFNKIDIIADIYIDTIAKFISSRKLNQLANYEKLLARPNKVRVAKLANFQLIDDTSKEAVAVKDIISTEELYLIVNKVYNHFRNLTEPQADKREVSSSIFNQLRESDES